MTERTWADDIDAALQRVDSPHDALTIIRLLRSGEAEMAVCDELHGSVVFRGEEAEIGHLAGRWTDAAGFWLYERMVRACDRRGVSFVGIKGRRGWHRFLRMKGLLPWD